jgi:hypothetical protein
MESEHSEWQRFRRTGFDGSASRHPNGSITSYTWAFGDGTTGTGKTIRHTYTHAGSSPPDLS